MLIREYAEGKERKTLLRRDVNAHPIKMHDTSELGIHKWEVNKYRNLLHEILKSAQTMKGFGGGEVCPGGYIFKGEEELCEVASPSHYLTQEQEQFY